jgi:glycosyltransferase involved in cell wall biosynthesis
MAEFIQGRNLKKVLIISYNFPPVGGGRVRRVLKFVKFLSEFGWEPMVLTVKRPNVPEYDYELSSEISDSTRIIRTGSFEFGSLARYIRNCHNGVGGRRDFIGRLRQFLSNIACRLKWWIFFPDSRIGWIPFCIASGYRTIKRESVDLIFATAEPFSSFISAVLLKKFTDRPLVVDFRDEWSGFSDYYFPDKNRIIKKLERLLERFIVKNADVVISVTQPIIRDFIARYPDQKQEKFVCITNGFDPDDFKGLPDKGHNDRFTITYAGSLYKLRTPEYFLKGVKQFLKREPDFQKRARILFIGTIEKEIFNLLDDDNLRQMVDAPGFLCFRDTLRHLINSDLLLYIEDQVPISDRLLPAKLFEYMACKKPIIALANEGTVKETIEYTGCGKVVSPYDIRSIVECLEYFYKNFKENRPLFIANKEKIEKFSRRNLTRKLAEEFDKILNAKT